jgi:uncharacterized protein YciI
MQFLVLGYDGKDDGAAERRAKARPHHIEMGDKLLEAGNLWYGAAMNDEVGNMIGSIYMVDFPDRDALNAWLEEEPYMVGGVWVKTDIIKCNTRDPWQFNRPKEFFESRQNV